MNIRWVVAFQICVSLCLLSLLSACTSKFPDTKETGIPITVAKPGTQDIDVDVVFENAVQIVQSTLPGAYFRGMVFSGRCQDLPRLQGRLILVFERVQIAIPRRQVVLATASVDTVAQTMDLYYEDYSDVPVKTRQQTLLNHRLIKEIAAIAHRHINELGLSDCDVTLTQLDESWDVRCGALNNLTRKCHFEIINGKISDKPR